MLNLYYNHLTNQQSTDKKWCTSLICMGFLFSLRGRYSSIAPTLQDLWYFIFWAGEVNAWEHFEHWKPSLCLPISCVIRDRLAPNLWSQYLQAHHYLSMWCKAWAHKAACVLHFCPQISHLNFLLRCTLTWRCILYLVGAMVKQCVHIKMHSVWHEETRTVSEWSVSKLTRHCAHLKGLSPGCSSFEWLSNCLPVENWLSHRVQTWSTVGCFILTVGELCISSSKSLSSVVLSFSSYAEAASLADKHGCSTVCGCPTVPEGIISSSRKSNKAPTVLPDVSGLTSCSSQSQNIIPEVVYITTLSP